MKIPIEFVSDCAYARLDMKVQNRVKQEQTVKWPRCKTAQVDGDRLVCALDWERQYDLVRVYRYRPHIAFLNLKTDDDLVRFVLWWGPLWLYGPSGEPEGGKQRYWAFHRKLKALVNLIQAFKSRDTVARRATIQEYADAQNDDPRKLREFVYSSKAGDDRRWILRASPRELRAVAEFCIATCFTVTSCLVCTWRDDRAEIGWAYAITSLEKAIEWMLWHDLAGRRPLTFCHECRSAFIPDSAHQRKYCSPECGHRVAARNWWRQAQKQVAERRKR